MYLQGSAADKKVRLSFGFAFKDPAPHAHPRLLILFICMQLEKKSWKSVNGHSDGLHYKDNNNQVCVCVCSK